MKLSELNPSENIKVLAYGDAGSGKTVLGCGFPGPIYVADFDGKISSASAYYNYIGEGDRLETIEYDNYMKKNDADMPFSRWTRKRHDMEIAAQKGEFPYKTVIVDSLTFFADMAMDKVIADNPGIKSHVKGYPSLQHYGIFNPYLKQQLAKLLALPCNIVVTSHIKTDKDELSGQIIRGPMLTGKLQTYIPILFPEVYRTYVERKGTETNFLLQTKPDVMYSMIRSQIPGLPHPVESKYESLVAHRAQPK